MKHRLPETLVLLLVLGALAAPVRAESAVREPVPAVVETQTSVSRDVFDAWLARGPQYLLSQVVPMPVTRERRFEGFRLSRWFPGHPEVTEGAVRTGDVVQRVNGRSVERPDQFLYVWKHLQGATEVRIEGLREGRRLKATLTIVDAPAAPPAAAPASEPSPGSP
jgi:type II secretory pathway component PulC